MASIRLIAIDLDGTLMGSADEFHLYNVFREKIREFQRRNNAVWLVCTGRDMKSFKSCFSPMRMMGLMPNYVIIKHAFIYKFTRFGYVPHVLWNLRIRCLVWAAQLSMRDALDEWRETILEFASKARVISRRKDRLWVAFDSKEKTDAVAELLLAKVAARRNVRMFKFLREIDIRAVPFTKGLAVSELARHIRVGAENTLAIGDGHNDISMLDGAVAARTGCPANAAPEVMAVVHKQGGHIAKGASLTGVIEILNAQDNGEICSDLPAGWADPSLGDNPDSSKPKDRPKHRGKLAWSCALVLAIYATLLAFASYNLIPGVSWIVVWPFRKAVSLVVKALSLF